MSFSIDQFINEMHYDQDKKHLFDSFELEDILYYRQQAKLFLNIKNKCLLTFNIYQDLINYLEKISGLDVYLHLEVENDVLDLREGMQYFNYFQTKLSHSFGSACLILQDNLTILFADENTYHDAEKDFAELRLFFKDIGYQKEIDFKVKEITPTEAIAPIIVKNIDKKNSLNKNINKNSARYNYRKKINEFTSLKINDLVDEENENLEDIKIEAKIFRVEERIFKNGHLAQTIYVKDLDNACMVKVFENRHFTKEKLALNTVGKYALFYGSYHYDDFSNDYVFEPVEIEYIDKQDDILKDDAVNKRIELHTHTNKSEMDGVCDPFEIVKAAFEMGQEAVAITDHAVVQGFPIAQRAVKELLKKDPDRKFKVIYGCELNVSDKYLNPIYNPNNDDLWEKEFVVFDLETTGLSSRHDRIIEFGAVLMHKGHITETKDFFINPQKEVSSHILNLTNIKEGDLKKAKTFAEVKDEIKDFLKNRVLVAHNASFDFNFLNEELSRLNEDILNNEIIDTLDLARLLFKNRRTYRLGNIARQYGVEYDEEVAHRADYDAQCLAKIFNLMLKDILNKGIKTGTDLNNYHTADDYVKKQAYHATVLCKDKEGLKDLFRLVSIAHTETLAVFGKANSKSAGEEYIAEPRILRETLEKYRSHLLVGSACQNGEVFQIAHTKGKQALREAISHYDYIEIQPLDNYRNLVVDRNLFTFEELKQYLRDIIEEAKAQNKIIVATGDVHYVTEEEKIFRDVYINTQGIGGVRHPLYVYNDEKRKRQISPDQHFFNTAEMKKAFAWLEDEQLIEDIVVNNTHLIAEQTDIIMPIHDKLYPPSVEGSVDKLKEEVYKTAKKRYGEPLPIEFEQRLKRELDSIIGNGYAVIYYVSHLLVKKSNADGYLVGSRGSVGSSLVATMAGITEVNAMEPHYICPNCHYLEWKNDGEYASGYDLPDAKCPHCGHPLIGDGQNIPFETFLGFHGDKVPDIDLNFSGDYQPIAHLFTREIFGSDHVFRAGTISTVAEKTAFGYVTGYCEAKEIEKMSRAKRQYLASGCEGVKRTTGQHPGGIIVIPNDMDVYDFTPVQYPANEKDSTWKTTHFDFHEIHDNVLKFDILGHVDPTAMRQLQTISGIDPLTIPMNDPATMSIFNSPDALGIINPDYEEKTGACGLPEFGTRFVRGILEETRPSRFSDLVIISGLSHGTDVWNNNAKDLIDEGVVNLQSVIGCRDDIMIGLIKYGLPSKASFDIMEKVRKGKGLSPEHEALMRAHNVPEWYIDSCKKIKYMFPKAHAVAYVIMAVRIAWFKVHYPQYYYVSFFSLRCDAYEIETMVKDAKGIKNRMDEIFRKMQSHEKGEMASKKERDLYDTLEICYEMESRGYHLSNIDLNTSLATEFKVSENDSHTIIPPFTILDGLGENVANSIIEARNARPFSSKEDLLKRTQLSYTLKEKMEKLGVLNDLDESEQTSLF